MSRADLERNRAVVLTLRRLVGENWPFLDEDDVDSISRHAGFFDDKSSPTLLR